MSEQAPQPDMAALRASISGIDQRILELLAERRDLSGQVAATKDARQRGIRDEAREKELLERLVKAGRAAGLDGQYVTRVFHEIIDDSVRLQLGYLQRLANPDDGGGRLAVAIQGTAGAYSHLAAQKFFAEVEERLQLVERDSFAEVIEAVERGTADYAMLPIENTTSGGINEVYDLLLHTTLSIVGEEVFRVQHCLVGAADVELDQLERVLSHPQAVAQCSRFLQTLGCKVETYTDTAMAVTRIQRDGNPRQAAIASEAAAVRHGLPILKRGIANQRGNYTRFLIAARKERQVDLRIPCKTSLVMSTGQQAGSLVDSLLIFKNRGLALTKLESRPILGNPFEEMFYVDVAGNTRDPRVEQALRDLTRVTRFVKVLGSYPSHHVPKTELSPRSLVDEPVDSAPTPAPPVASTDADARLHLVSVAHKPERTVIDVARTRLGNGQLVVIAGPSAAEDEAQLLECARVAADRGAAIFAADCFRPTKSPYSFQGAGVSGLELLRAAADRYGLPVLTEVTEPGQVAEVSRIADVLRIGGRNMQHPALLREVGRGHRPVVLTRGPLASLDDLLHAAETIVAEGNQQVILCEQGIRTFEGSTQTTLDLGAIPSLKARTHLPVIVDVARAARSASLVPSLARAAQAVGADAIVLEIHPAPDQARVGGDRALTFASFADVMRDLFPPAPRP